MAVPYTFGSATTSIPLSQLDSNFATTITLGNTAIQLGNTVTTLNNMTFANVTISSTSTAITPAQGGTGLTTLTANNVLLGNGTSSVAFVAPGTSGNVLASNGTTWTSTALPAFSAWRSNTAGTQTLTSSTYVKIIFDSKDFDTANCFSSSRFTPTVAGYYQINGEVDMFNNTGISFVGIFKNGSEYKRGNGVNAANTETYSSVSSVVYLNGSTDYLELYAYAGGGATPGAASTSAGQYTYFNGVLVRTA